MIRPRADRSNYNVYAAYSPEEILAQTSLDAGTKTFQFGDHLLYVDLWEDRYEVMKRDNCTCQHCGKVGTVMLLERMMPSENNPKNIRREPHFNLYHLTPDNKLILLTIDHVVPKSKGGPDNIGNYQLLCEPCNRRKKDKVNYKPPSKDPRRL